MCVHFVGKESKAQRDKVIYLNWDRELKFEPGSNFKTHALLFLKKIYITLSSSSLLFASVSIRHCARCSKYNYEWKMVLVQSELSLVGEPSTVVASHAVPSSGPVC